MKNFYLKTYALICEFECVDFKSAINFGNCLAVDPKKIKYSIYIFILIDCVILSKNIYKEIICTIDV